MNFIHTAFFLFSFSTSFAQSTTFAPVGASWRFNEAVISNGSEGSKQYRYTSLKDTMINGLETRLLQAEIWQNGLFAPINEANKYVSTIGEKVYYQVNGEFVLLFDFAAKKGDTIHSRIELVPVIMTSCSSPQTPVSFTYVIDSLGLIVVDGVELRIQFVKHIEDEPWIIHTIIERIGASSDETWFGSGTPCVTSGFPAKLRCYQDNEILFKGNIFGEDCDFVAAFPELSGHAEVTFGPNPFNESFTVKVPYTFGNRSELNVYNLYGNPVIKTILQFPITSIHAQGLADGVYFWQIVESETIITTGKCIKLCK